MWHPMLQQYSPAFVSIDWLWLCDCGDRIESNATCCLWFHISAALRVVCKSTSPVVRQSISPVFVKSLRQIDPSCEDQLQYLKSIFTFLGQICCLVLCPVKLSEPWACRSQDGFCFEVPLEVRFTRLSSVYAAQLWLKTSKNTWLAAVPRWVSISFQVPSGPGDLIFFSFLGLAGACEESEKLHHWDLRWVRLFPTSLFLSWSSLVVMTERHIDRICIVVCKTARSSSSCQRFSVFFVGDVLASGVLIVEESVFSSF